ADHMKGFGLVDDIIPEPAGGAHWDYDEAALILKEYLKKVLAELKDIPQADRVNGRIEKFGKMGFWEEEISSSLSAENPTATEEDQA
ncbi:acetyl-CoA carboxylase carboxyl transferase subunit alpha, partial [Flavisolibacter sp. BT320]|nr:acetyl-CoA carboxylase carboxyl transferase subunit alpha [Flavisolibacter longurius]